VRILLAGVAVAMLAGTASAARLDTPPALVGADYYGTDCHGGPNFIRDDADPALVRQQLFAMHTLGLNSMAEVLSYTSDAGLIYGGHGGAIPIQPDGTLGEPYRSRLIAYLEDVRDAGFGNLTIRFYPYGPNSPFPWTTGVRIDDWNPSLFAADWRFVEDVHDLVKQYGPPSVRFDLMAEGPPNDYEQISDVGFRTDDFIKELYSDYVDKYGNGDVFFSMVDDTSSTVHLVQDLRATGRPLPNWWGYDIDAGNDVLTHLGWEDAKLTALGVGGSVVLEEVAYEDAAAAAGAKAYNATAAHPLVEVEQYPYLGEPNCGSAPYSGDAFLAALGIQIGPLLATVDAKGKAAFTTSDGVPVKALLVGRRYTIVVTDNSSKAGFRLFHFGYVRQTSAGFRGTVTWSFTPTGDRWSFASVVRKKVVGATYFATISRN
jgi:hypothetical protein